MEERLPRQMEHKWLENSHFGDLGDTSKHLAIYFPKPQAKGSGLCLEMKQRSHIKGLNSVLEGNNGAYQENNAKPQDPSKDSFCSLNDGRFWMGKRAWILDYNVWLERWFQYGSKATEFAQFGVVLREIWLFLCKVTKMDLKW